MKTKTFNQGNGAASSSSEESSRASSSAVPLHEQNTDTSCDSLNETQQENLRQIQGDLFNEQADKLRREHQLMMDDEISNAIYDAIQKEINDAIQKEIDDALEKKIDDALEKQMDDELDKMMQAENQRQDQSLTDLLAVDLQHQLDLTDSPFLWKDPLLPFFRPK